MDYGSYSDELRRRKLDSPAARFLTGAFVLSLHLLVIGGMVFWGGGCRSTKEPKEKIYKVKLGGSEPSHAPVVGPPERLRPTGNTSPAPSEPAVKPPPPKPRPAPKEPSVKPLPKPKVKPKPAPKEPSVKPLPKPKPKPKPKKTKTDPRRRDRQQTNSIKEPAAKPSPRTRRNTRTPKPEDDGIYHPPGGSNFNPNVKIGSRDAGQLRGPADHKTPMAGRDDEADQRWQNGVQKFVEMLWIQPEDVFLNGARPRAILELVIASDGRVLRARMVKPSGNARMDGSIQILIQQLKVRKAPVPPDGQQTIEVELVTR